MNNARRKAIAEAIRAADDLRGAVDALREAIETIRDEEQESYDNLPESFQLSDRGEASQSAIQALEDAIYTVEAFDIDELVAQLGTAAE